jgi:NAD(P)-dependent dehydrogenase (short-subunit alcohol dehydrogenase family)
MCLWNVKTIEQALTELGGLDILVNNAAHQASFKEITDISDEEWDLTFKVNIHAMFYLTKAAVPHMKPGSALIIQPRSTPTRPIPRFSPMRRDFVQAQRRRQRPKQCQAAT